MRVTFLGTGTSVGVPVIGCPCRVCASGDPRDKRTRQSLWIQSGETSILVDASVDFRAQALRHGIRKVDAVLLTHAHADHILGLDETRVLAYWQKGAIPVYGERRTLESVRRTFWYAFDETPDGGGKPKLDLIELPAVLQFSGLTILPVEGDHGSMPVTGYRIDGFAYLTDCKRVPPAAVEVLRGLDTLVINALRRSPDHPTHMTLSEALAAIEEVAPRRAYLVHMGHEMGHADLAASLPDNIQPAYDGLTLEF